jgi:hypothetical protein
MQIVIHTIEGTFIVPTDKQAELVYWLKNNAIKAGQQQVREEVTQGGQTYTGRQLINEQGL